MLLLLGRILLSCVCSFYVFYIVSLKCPLIITNLFEPTWAVSVWFRAEFVPADSALGPQYHPELTVYFLF